MRNQYVKNKYITYMSVNVKPWLNHIELKSLPNVDTATCFIIIAIVGRT